MCPVCELCRVCALRRAQIGPPVRAGSARRPIPCALQTPSHDPKAPARPSASGAAGTQLAWRIATGAPGPPIAPRVVLGARCSRASARDRDPPAHRREASRTPSGAFSSTADCARPTADCQLQTADCRLPTADCGRPDRCGRSERAVPTCCAPLRAANAKVARRGKHCSERRPKCSAAAALQWPCRRGHATAGRPLRGLPARSAPFSATGGQRFPVCRRRVLLRKRVGRGSLEGAVRRPSRPARSHGNQPRGNLGAGRTEIG